MRAELIDGGASVRVWLPGRSEPLTLSSLWVRDHSRDPVSYDAFTRQRAADTLALAPDVRATSVSIIDDRVVVEWANGHPASHLTADLLAPLVAPPATTHQTHWRSPSAVELDVVDYEGLMNGSAVDRWLRSIRRYGFAVVTGSPTEQADAGAMAGLIGYVRETVFGGLWTLSSGVVEHNDSAYGNDPLEPHTDGSYSHDGPGVQFFLCSERTGTGGESVLVDGYAAAAELHHSEPDAFALLTEVSVPGHYIEDGVDLRAARPTIRLDDHGEILQVTFNNYDRAPFLLPEPQMTCWYRAYGALHDLLVDRSAWWTRRLEPGDALLFDNWRCLHGRMGYTGKRVFHGGYLNHEDLESRLRHLD